MLFFSKLLGASVIDSSDRYLGKLQDITVRASPTSHYPGLSSIVIKKWRKNRRAVPFALVENMSPQEITLKTNLERLPEASLTKDDILLKRDVLDRQIVDTEGSRVVRVNDIQLGTVEGAMSLVGVDVSTRGLLRRMGLTTWRMFKFIQSKLIDWKHVQLVHGALKLSTAGKDLVRVHPADLAEMLHSLSTTQGSELLQTVGSEYAAKVFEELDPKLRHILIEAMGVEKTAQILENMSVDEVVDLLKALPRKEAHEIMAKVHEMKRQKVKEVMKYADDSAGGIMSTEFVSGRPEWTVKQALEHIKKVSPAHRSILFLYVTKEDGAFSGVVSIRRLLVLDQSETLGKAMKKLKRTQTVRVDQPFDEVARLMTKYNLYSVAVLDGGKMVGVITGDDVMRRLVEK